MPMFFRRLADRSGTYATFFQYSETMQRTGYQKYAATTWAGPPLNPTMLVATTICMFLRYQSGGPVLAISAIAAGSVRNSPTAWVPNFARPDAVTTVCPVVGSRTRVTTA